MAVNGVFFVLNFNFYVVSDIHNFDKMQISLEEVMSNADPNCSIHWFEIDEKFHGSVATFPSKEVYESMLDNTTESIEKFLQGSSKDKILQ